MKKFTVLTATGATPENFFDTFFEGTLAEAREKIAAHIAELESADDRTPPADWDAARSALESLEPDEILECDEHYWKIMEAM